MIFDLQLSEQEAKAVALDLQLQALASVRHKELWRNASSVSQKSCGQLEPIAYISLSNHHRSDITVAFLELLP